MYKRKIKYKHMGIFDFFKSKNKEESSFDPLNIKVEDLKKGDLFDYDLETWIVKEEFEYDWGNEVFTKELLIEQGGNELTLSIDVEDGLELTIQKAVKIRKLNEYFVDHLKEKQEPLKKIEFEGVNYYLNSKNYGYYRNVSTNAEGEECISWDFYNDNEDQILSIEQWSEEEFEASVGKVITSRDISNILPSAK